MRISLLQYPLYWADKAANLRFFGEKLAQLSGQTDVAVLPEMFTTGFCTSQPELAETMNGDTMRTVSYWATTYDFAIVGSFIATENGQFFNRAFFATPDGNVHFADKRHLFALGGEADFFTRGNKRLEVNFRGARFCVLVCYDIRFPAWSRNLTGCDYDVLIYVANFPVQRNKEWATLLPARAVENQCCVCAVNRIGSDELGISYCGNSVLLDTRLRFLAQFAEGESGTQTAVVNIDEIREYRQKFPVWKDVDNINFL